MNQKSSGKWVLASALLFYLLAGCQAETPPSEPAEPSYASSFTAVQLSEDASPSTQIAVYACAGMHNRRLGGSIFVQATSTSLTHGARLDDSDWLERLGLQPASTRTAAEFLQQCKTDFGGCIRYDYSTQHEILPAILTIGAASEAVPMSEGDLVQCDTPVLDATTELADKQTPYLATRYAYQNHLSQTTGLAMLDPGYDRYAKDLSNPDLIDDMTPELVDYVFSEKLFVTFLINGCIDDHVEKVLLQKIVNESGWDTPIGVYGYNSSWLVGGYLYEAQTRCLDSANMGAIPTETTNLSFFSTRRPAITSPTELQGNPPQSVSWDPDKTYVAFIIGDGDNIRYIMSSRKAWLQQRLDACAGANTSCPALSWSISPHLHDIAPDVLEWYYKAVRQTGADYFVLPPSGHQYAYPGGLNEKDQLKFVEATAEDGMILGTRSVVHWEWYDGWRYAEDVFLPRYANGNNQIQGIFPVNVPYLFDMFTWWPDEQFFRVLAGTDGGKTAVFKPFSWRGINDSDDRFFPNPKRMAEKLGAYPKGTVTWVYMTSDGGLTLENSYMAMLEHLPAHVELVSADAAATLAIAAGGQ